MIPDHDLTVTEVLIVDSYEKKNSSHKNICQKTTFTVLSNNLEYVLDIHQSMKLNKLNYHHSLMIQDSKMNIVFV